MSETPILKLETYLPPADLFALNEYCEALYRAAYDKGVEDSAARLESAAQQEGNDGTAYTLRFAASRIRALKRRPDRATASAP